MPTGTLARKHFNHLLPEARSQQKKRPINEKTYRFITMSGPHTYPPTRSLPWKGVEGPAETRGPSSLLPLAGPLMARYLCFLVSGASEAQVKRK